MTRDSDVGKDFFTQVSIGGCECVSSTLADSTNDHFKETDESDNGCTDSDRSSVLFESNVVGLCNITLSSALIGSFPVVISNRSVHDDEHVHDLKELLNPDH